MAIVYEKGLTEIVQNIITNIHDVIPEADTKEGTYLRDVFINPISDEIAAMYGDMQLLRLSQSVVTAVGNDLDMLAANFFITRKSATKASGKLRFYITNTNKSVNTLKDTDLPDSLLIDIGTIVSNSPVYGATAVEYQTTESAYQTRSGLKTLPIDGSTGYRFIEVAAEAINSGTTGNIGSSQINLQVTNTNSAIAFVNNPYTFSGGTDYEPDIDLQARIGLAIMGCNIGTKNGYLSYILAQDGVVDAIVIGAGDSIMFRDGGYMNADGTYQHGKGGMVDIYVRGRINQEDSWAFALTSNYIYGSNAFSNIALPYQPVNSIVSIVSQNTGYTFVNAADFDTEKFTIKTSADSPNTTVQVNYCRDILWDFSVKDDFPDKEYFPLPAGITSDQITALKTTVDSELNSAFTYLSNITYGLDWSTVAPGTGDGSTTTLFVKQYHNGLVYKIKAKDDSNLNGRQFIKKQDKIYVRYYDQPDYILSKDIDVTGYSINGTDSIQWIKHDKLTVQDILTITYNYDYLVSSLQAGIDNVRCLTADVLVKQAQIVPIEIIADVSCYSYVNLSTIKRNIIDDITNWLDTLQKLGGYFDESDIVAIIKQRDEVDSVNLNTISIAIKGYTHQKGTPISCASNQYFKTENIVLNINYDTTIVM